MSTKTPQNVADAIKSLSTKDMVAVQTYIAGLKTTIKDLQDDIKVLKDGDGDAHAHFHGHEKCTHDHSHDDAHGDAHAHDDGHSHDHHDDKPAAAATEACSGGHDHAHSHGHAHGHDHATCTADHDHGHEHGHGSHDKKDDMPAWKKKAMESGNDPMAAPFGGSWNTESSVDATAPAADAEGPLPPLYTEGEDFDAMQSAKQAGSDLKATGDLEGALGKFTEAVLAAPPSALLYANRADCLSKLKRPKAAVRDCKEALKLNPDSAKALRILGKAEKDLGEWKKSRANLSASQTIDFDDSVVADLKFVTEKVKEMDATETKKRVDDEAKLRKRAGEIKKAREEAAAEEMERQAAAGGGMPGMPGGMPGMPGGMPGMPGGMPGMPGGMPGGMPAGMQGMMGALMKDPELAEGMKNPKVQAAFQGLMSQPGGVMGLLSNPSKLQELMSDPEVGPFMNKLMSKMGGGLGGMGAGMGGMPGMAGMSGASSGGSGAGPMDEDDVPDMPEM